MENGIPASVGLGWRQIWEIADQAGGLSAEDCELIRGALRWARQDTPRVQQCRCPKYPPPAYGVSWRARAGGALSYRVSGFAPKDRVPRFSEIFGKLGV